MKKKNGFISMTLVYTFLILFMFLMLAILRTYTEKNKYLEAINEQINNDISSNKTVRSLIVSKVIDQNMPTSDTNLNYFQISNGTFGNGNGFFYMDKRKYDNNYDLLDHTDENKDANTNRIYYFRGSERKLDGDETNLNNYMLFVGLCFRIVRTNEDGSIRLIYYGPATNRQCMTNDDLILYNETNNTTIPAIGKSKFNTSASINYQTSPIQGLLDTWYEENIVQKIDPNINKYFSNYVSKSAIFCNDKTDFKARSLVPHFKDETILNIYDDSNIYNSISLNCNSSDSFSGMSKNDATTLLHPVGLLTAEDVALAGGYLTDENDIYRGGGGGVVNVDYYLYFDFDYWTMSPYNTNSMIYVNGRDAGEMGTFGTMQAGSPTQEHYVIPVLSLSPGLSIKSGTGTYINPFRVF